MKNAYEIRGEVTAIIINSPKYGTLETLISTDKLEIADSFPNTWGVIWGKTSKTFYVYGHLPREVGKRGHARLHRYITNAPEGMEVDHKNNNGLINTDDNLRIVSSSENKQNFRGSHSNSKSGIRGVSWSEGMKKWNSRVYLNKEKIYSGYFDDIAKAEEAVKEVRATYMPYSKEASL